MDLMHVEQPLTGSAWAIGVFAFCLIVGAIPVASVGLVLSALTRRDGHRWIQLSTSVYTVAVGQICSLVATVPMWLMLLVSSWLAVPGGTGWESAATLILSASVVGGCFALGAWRGLMAAALPESPPSILS